MIYFNIKYFYKYIIFWIIIQKIIYFHFYYLSFSFSFEIYSGGFIGFFASGILVLFKNFQNYELSLSLLDTKTVSSFFNSGSIPMICNLKLGIVSIGFP